VKIIDAAIDFAALSQIASVKARVVQGRVVQARVAQARVSRSLLTEVSIRTIGIIRSRLSIALLPWSPEEEKESAAYESCASGYSTYNPSDKSGMAVSFLRVVKSIRALGTARGTIGL
jgi:hypothetical protein